jgi:peptidoglycan hydrolase CwlO-like protein
MANEQEIQQALAHLNYAVQNLINTITELRQRVERLETVVVILDEKVARVERNAI